MASYAKLPTPATPVKAKRLRRETLKTQQSDYKTKSADVEKELRQELRGAVFVETSGFLDTFFSVPPAIVDRILAAARTKGYHDGSKWTAFPKINATQHNYEKDLYNPFVDVANFITDECSMAPRFDLRWLSDPNRSPTSVDTKAADLEPDIVGVLGFPKAASPEAEVCLKSERKPRESKPPKPPWRRVHVPMEVKRENVQWAAALQLFKYIRQVFQESFDRRFVFGIVLARSNVTVYLADRSGILGSENFDMHEEPHLLIRVIAGFALFEACKLGWDTSLTVVPRPPTDHPSRMSFEVPYRELEVGGDWHDHYWRLEMPKPGSDEPSKMSHETEAFVLFQHLSLSRGEVILGRATRVWKAWHQDAMNLPLSQRTVYIVKDTWRDDRRTLEGELYAKIGPCEGVAEMHSYAVVQIDGEKDTTSSLIRRNLLHKGSPRAIDAVQNLEQDYALNSPGNDSYPVTHYVVDYLPTILDENARPRGRTHSRLVMKTYGWPIKFAKSLLELVGAMRDAILGHRYSYEKGVLHRDISLGNIIITGKSERGHRGALIDYDNAILWREHQTLTDDPLSGTRPFMSSEILAKRPIFPRRITVVSRKQRTVGVPTQRIQLETPRHDAVHDLEAFFWVLVWLCMSRDGPATRRVELLTESRDSSHLRTAFVDLFEADDGGLASNKERMFLAKIHFEATVLPNMSGYCEPLEQLVEEFYDILAAAHKSRDYQGLYDQIIDAFDAAEKTLMELPSDFIAAYRALEQAEQERRRQDLGGHWDVDSPPTKSTAGKPHILGSSWDDEPVSPTPPKRRK